MQSLVSALYDTSHMIAERLRPMADVDTKAWRTALKAASGHLGDQFNLIIQACDAEDWGKMAMLSTCVFEEFALPPSAWEWETFQELGKYKAGKIAALCAQHCESDDELYCGCPGCDNDCEYDSELEDDEAQVRESLSNVYVPPVKFSGLSCGSPPEPDEPEVL
jgi:hypothetical protein